MDSLCLLDVEGMSMDNVRVFEQELQDKTNKRVTEGVDMEQANVAPS